MLVKLRLAKELYTVPRYWYHISTTLKDKKELLKPRENDEGFNRSENEPNTKRICVSPTLEQCLTAVPYGKHDKISIYRTEKKTLAKKSRCVFDAKLTQEAWITSRMMFVRVGILQMEDIKRDGHIIITEAASDGSIESSQECLKWWVALNPWDFVVYDRSFKKRA